jgi:pimeloyl-ACP methyl ester carboxylesterase
MKRSLMAIAGLILLAYLGLCGFLYASQGSMVYYPTGAPGVRAPVIEMLNVDDAVLKLSVQPNESAQALIYFGGNAEDVSLSLGDFTDTFPGHAIYMLHYRGYGGSTGVPAEKMMHKDALAVYDLISTRHKDITIIGRSLGSGVAVQLAAKRNAQRLVLVAPFDSIVRLAQQNFPFFPASLLLTERYESWRYASGITTPTTVIAAEMDEVIPAHSTSALVDAFKDGVATLTIIKGANHNNLSLSKDYMTAVAGR